MQKPQLGGRALGNLGIGLDTSVASADEVVNAIENQNKPATPQVKQWKLTKQQDEWALAVQWA